MSEQTQQTVGFDAASEGAWQALRAHIEATNHEWGCDADLGPYCSTCAEREP